MRTSFDLGKFDPEVTLMDAAVEEEILPTMRMVANASLGVEPFDAYYAAQELLEKDTRGKGKAGRHSFGGLRRLPALPLLLPRWARSWRYAPVPVVAGPHSPRKGGCNGRSPANEGRGGAALPSLCRLPT